MSCRAHEHAVARIIWTSSVSQRSAATRSSSRSSSLTGRRAVPRKPASLRVIRARTKKPAVELIDLKRQSKACAQGGVRQGPERRAPLRPRFRLSGAERCDVVAGNSSLWWVTVSVVSSGRARITLASVSSRSSRPGRSRPAAGSSRARSAASAASARCEQDARPLTFGAACEGAFAGLGNANRPEQCVRVLSGGLIGFVDDENRP